MIEKLTCFGPAPVCETLKNESTDQDFKNQGVTSHQLDPCFRLAGCCFFPIIQKECANDFINFLLKYQVKQKTVVIPQCNRTEICAAPVKLDIKDFSFS